MDDSQAISHFGRIVSEEARICVTSPVGFHCAAKWVICQAFKRRRPLRGTRARGPSLARHGPGDSPTFEEKCPKVHAGRSSARPGAMQAIPEEEELDFETV